MALHAGALPVASRVALPLVKPAGSFTAAMGLSAIVTALNAFTMPAPQVVVVQAHSTLEVEPAVHSARGGVAGGKADSGGKGVALALMRAINCAGVRLALADSMSAAMPETMGAEKLVPRLELVWSV